MLTIERETIPSMIKRFVAHPDIYPFVVDDFSPSAEDYQPPTGKDVYWLFAYRGAVPVGLFLLFPLNAINFDIHAAVFPWARGTKWSRLAGEAALDWIWKNTRCRRVTAGCPAFNARALGWVKAIGFREFGVNHASFQKSGTLHDLIMLGISKPPEQSNKEK